MQTVRNLHRAHLLAIPFENIEIQLGEIPSLEHDAIFSKLVVNERGGWCFEQNLLFAWALKQIGVRHELIGASVNRTKAVDGAPINHLAVLAYVEEKPYLCDVGFGNGCLTPLPLEEGTFNDTRFDFKLVHHGHHWRFYNHRENGASYDFTGEPVDRATIEAANATLATALDSPFVQTLVVARLTEDGFSTLTNAALRRHTPTQINEESSPNAAALALVLKEHFSLEIPNVDSLWTRVAEQHKKWLRQRIRGF